MRPTKFNPPNRSMSLRFVYRSSAKNCVISQTGRTTFTEKDLESFYKHNNTTLISAKTLRNLQNSHFSRPTVIRASVNLQESPFIFSVKVRGEKVREYE
ncbi:hypothetical protein DVH24_017228 [Malus domestica]|uniref:Uncharacterized protein n=1 Tax=Malus domestica TaxID=3750 RepID=A0A498IVA8_MALDO|nr:hypothetical protein DVH24_017228 [Malus domestica]